MKLMTKALAKKMPKLYGTEHIPTEDKVVVAKLFHPASDWTWYIIEYDGNDVCWGLVSGNEKEFGYFSISELEAIHGPFGLSVERDIFFRPIRVVELAAFNQGGVVF
ncbi:MAG TPA: DUF2958 domain-containing protein [Candidatus Saccharimonadales bacterium]|nr:DUF2958 domain-containing protein [Candidatus Saccharimonadales bacterium]